MTEPDGDYGIEFGELSEEEGLTNVRTIMMSAIAHCPHMIMVPEHYFADGSCRCADPDHTEMSEWGYRWDGSRWTGSEEA